MSQDRAAACIHEFHDIGKNFTTGAFTALDMRNCLLFAHHLLIFGTAEAGAEGRWLNGLCERSLIHIERSVLFRHHHYMAIEDGLECIRDGVDRPGERRNYRPGSLYCIYSRCMHTLAFGGSIIILLLSTFSTIWFDPNGSRRSAQSSQE